MRHRHQRYVFVGVGKPAHEPGLTVSVCPTVEVPVTVGALVFVGGAETATVEDEMKVVVPATLVAATLRAMNFPASAPVMT